MTTARDCARTRSTVPKRLRRPSDVVALVQAVLDDQLPPPGEVVICLDAERRLTGLALRPEAGEHPVDAEQLVDLAHELDATAVVLVSFLFDERELAIEADVDGFLALARACLERHVLLFDHVLLAGGSWRSMWDVARASATGDPAA
ncbi:MAG TPA: hypothetical protein VFW06_11180 [Acidimicrobiia bacterium]|nr:hypothetical protein [Acidimicrobiia bacterium]